MKIKLTEAVTADQIRQSMSGFVGPKFAKKASDEDIMKMVDLKDKISKLQNTHILPIQKQIDALYKQYKIKSNKGIEESTSINEVQYKDALAQFNSELKKLSPIKRMATHFNKTVDQVLRAIQPYISVSKFENGDVKQIKIHFTESNSNIMIKHIKNFTKQESVNEGKKDDLIKAIEDIRDWVEDERNPKKYMGLLSNIDYAMKLAMQLKKKKFR